MNVSQGRTIGALCAGCVSLGGLGFEAAPVMIGLSAALLVRVPLIKPHSRVLSEISFTMLGMLGSFVTIVDQHSGPGPAFWWGIGYGAIASSLAEIGKSAMWSGVQSRLQAAAKVFMDAGNSK